MSSVRRILPVLAVACCLPLPGCGKPSPRPEAPSPTPAPEPGFAGVPAQAPQAVSSPEPAAPPVAEVSAPQQVNTDADDAGNRAVRAEVLKRIDVMPNLGEDEKDKLYVQVERARGMGRVITIPFASGARTVGAGAVAGITKALALPQIEKFSSDPTVVFVVLGYADTKGDPKLNQAISLQRADAVVDVLKNKAGVMNVVHAVGMGGSSFLDPSAPEKNRVVEVWAVLP